MYKCLSAVAGLFIGLLFVVNPSEAAQPTAVVNTQARYAATAESIYDCTNRIDRWDSDAYSGVKHAWAQATVGYRHCVAWGYDQNDHPAYVEVRYVVGAYNVEGGSMSCGQWYSYLDGFTFNFYFWRPYTGANFNPGAFKVPCDESTTNGRTVWYNSGYNLYFGPGSGSDRQPRWKVNATINRNGDFDSTKTHAQDFNPFS